MAKLLLIEDEFLVYTELIPLLEEMGHTVSHVTNYVDAIQAMGGRAAGPTVPFDFLVIDFRFPMAEGARAEPNGHRFIAWLGYREITTPWVLFTSSSPKEIEMDIKRSEVKDLQIDPEKIIRKWDEAQLVNAIAAACKPA